MSTGAQGAAARSIPGADVPGRARTPPRFSAQPRHLPAFDLDGHGQSLQPALDSVLQAFRAGIVGSRPLGQAGHLPAVNLNPTEQVHLYPYAWTGSGGVYVPASDLNLSGSFYVDGSSLLLVGGTTFDGVSLSLASVTSAGMAGLYLTANFAAGQHLLSTSVQLQVTPNTTKLGGAFLNADLPAGTFWAVGLMAGLTAMRQVTDLGYYRGDDAARLAEAHGIDVDQEGIRRTELVHLRGQSLAVRGGGGTFKIAALVKLEMARSRQTLLRCVGSPEHARAFLFDDAGLAAWARNKQRALQWRAERIAMPTLAEPSALALGDEVVDTTSRSLSPTVIAGNLAVFFGVQGFWRQDRAVGIHRLDADHVEVTYNPTRIVNAGIFVASPFGPEVDLGRDGAQSLRQCFTFDLREPAAQTALAALRTHSLGPGLAMPISASSSFATPCALGLAMQEGRDVLPRGVTRRWVHAVASREWRYGLGVDWRLVPYFLVPKGFVMALGVHQSHITERQLVTDGQTHHLCETRTRQLAFDRFFAGRMLTNATAQRRFIAQDDGAIVFDGLTVRAEWQLLGARKNATQARLVRPIRQRFALPTVDARPSTCRHDRTVSLERDLTEARLGLPPEHPSRYVHWRMAARQSGVGTRVAMRLLHSLDKQTQTTTAASDAARTIQTFVTRQGLSGCAFVFRAAQKPAPLQLVSIASATEAAISAAASLRLKYAAPLTVETCAGAAFARLRAAVACQRRLTQAAQDVAHDPFLRPADAQLLNERLTSAQGDLAHVAAMPDAVQHSLAGPVQAAARQYFRRPWHTHRATTIRAIDGLFIAAPPLSEAVAALSLQYAHTPMPTSFVALSARAQAVWAVERRVAAYAAWLAAALGPMDPELRSRRKVHMARLQARLCGPNKATGLWAPGTLGPAARQALRQAGRARPVAEQCTWAHRRIMRDLDHLGGPCPL